MALRESTKRLAAHAKLLKVPGHAGQTTVHFHGHVIGHLWEDQAIVRPIKRWFASANTGRICNYGFEHRAEAVAAVISHYIKRTGSSSARHNDYMDQMDLNDLTGDQS